MVLTVLKFCLCAIIVLLTVTFGAVFVKSTVDYLVNDDKKRIK